MKRVQAVGLNALSEPMRRERCDNALVIEKLRKLPRSMPVVAALISGSKSKERLHRQFFVLLRRAMQRREAIFARFIDFSAACDQHLNRFCVSPGRNNMKGRLAESGQYLR